MTDTPAETLRAIAQAIETEDELCVQWVRDSLAGMLHEAAEEVDALAASPPPTLLPACGAPGPRQRGHREPCDRPERHKGDCSWMAEVHKRRTRDYEAKAAMADVFKSQLDHAERLLAQRTRELDIARLQAKGWFRRKAKERADERG